MDYELFLRKYSSAHRVPAIIFSDKKLILKGYENVQDYNLPLYIASSLPLKLPPLWYSHSPEQLYFGGISLPETENMLFIGPVVSNPCTRMQAAEIIHRLGRPERDAATLMRGLNTFQNTDIGQLKSMLSLLSLYFYQDISSEPEYIAFEWAAIFPSSAITIHELNDNPTGTDGIENFLLSCIQYGKVKEMDRFINETLLESTSPIDDINLLRNYIIGANMIASRTAMSAGLSSQLANEIADYYLDIIMMIRNLNELNHLFYRFMMDYATQVQKMNVGSFHTPFASKIHHYIYAHIYEKLSTKKIAEALHLNENYICAKFKEETGLTIVSHIQDCKITEAKFLLTTKQYRGSEISDLLCFSSQSYFTSVFRRHTGMTPQQFGLVSSEIS